VVNYDNGGEYDYDVYRNNEIEDFIKYHAPLANGYSVEKNNGSENTRLGSVVSYTNGGVEYYDPLRDKVDKTKIDWYNELEKERNRANETKTNDKITSDDIAKVDALWYNDWRHDLQN
jgi:hypothetical protein